MDNSFKTNFEKTAFVGALARGAGRLSSMTSRAGNSLVSKAKTHASGLKEHVTRNFKAGVNNTPGSSYKTSLSVSKAKATRNAQKSEAIAKQEIRDMRTQAKPMATPQGAKPPKQAKPAAAAPEVKKPGLSDEAKKRIAVGAGAAGVGMYAGASSSQDPNAGYQ